MSKLKTVETDNSVMDFITSFSNTETKISDSLQLVSIMQKASGLKAKMWGTSIIGFGKYHYIYKSGHQGDAPLVGFSPRKTSISLYVFSGLEEHEYLLNRLGKFKKGKACIYVKKLSDINIDELTILVKFTINYLKTKYE